MENKGEQNNITPIPPPGEPSTQAPPAAPAPSETVGPPGILTGEEIQRLGLIEPLNFDPKYLKSTSYDLTLGPDVYVCGQGEVKLIRLGNFNSNADADPYGGEIKDTVPVESFGTVIFSTKESIRLDKYTNIVAHIGLRIKYGLKGFILQVGPQMEPGYNGPLFGALLNTRSKQQFMPKDSRVLTIEFCRTSSPASVGQNGKYKPKKIKNLREFLDNQNIEDDTLIEPSLVKEIKNEFDACQEMHGLRSQQQDRIISQKRYKVALIALIITAFALIINPNLFDNINNIVKRIFSTNNTQQMEMPTQDKQGGRLKDQAVNDANRFGQKQQEIATPAIITKKRALTDNTVMETNDIAQEKDSKIGNLLKEHNEP